MRILDDAIIPREKLKDYLLTPRRRNDKSGFLAQAGFTQENPDQLELAIRQFIAENDAISDRLNKYGTFYRVEGELYGPDATLLTVTIWLQTAVDNRFRFVTLKPAR